MVNRSCFLILTFPFLISSAAAAQSFPTAAGRINDFANVIDPATEAELDRQIDQLEQKTSSEIAIATVASLDGMSVEEYANKLFKEWGIGQQQQDNGVLVLVAPTERKMRIEVGYGLEGVLPDGLAGEVIRDQFTPKFKSNDYSGGIKDGVTRVIGIVEKHQVLTPEELARFNESDSDDSTTMPPWIMVPFFGVFVAVGFGLLGTGIGTKTVVPTLFGGLFGALPLSIATFFIPMVSLLTLVPFAIFMTWVGRRIGRTGAVRNSLRRNARSANGWAVGMTDSDSDSDSSDSDSSSSSSSSSSDFGGGDSGGGGASGSW